MAKTTVKSGVTKAPTATVVTATSEPETMPQLFRVSEATSEDEIIRQDSAAGVGLEFDFVHFKKLSDEFVATLKPSSQKAYWLSKAEFEDRSRRANIALHEVGVDPMTMILDRPRGRNNPLIRDGEKVQKLVGREWYITWKVQGGEGDFESARQAGFEVVRRPTPEQVEAKEKDVFKWAGEVWKIPDGTSDLTSGEAIYNVMMFIRRSRFEDHNKAMSMASHNAYAQVKRQFVEGSDNISRDMLGGKEKVLPPDWDLDQISVEQHTVGVEKK